MSSLFVIPVLIMATLGSPISETPIGAQTNPGLSTQQSTAVRNVLGSAGLPNVIDVPLHYKLLRVSIPPGTTIKRASVSEASSCKASANVT